MGRVSRLASVLAVATLLLVLALLTGGVRDGPGESALASDSQPGIANSGAGPQQVGCLPGDDDCDGFSVPSELDLGS